LLGEKGRRSHRVNGAEEEHFGGKGERGRRGGKCLPKSDWSTVRLRSEKGRNHRAALLGRQRGWEQGNGSDRWIQDYLAPLMENV